MILVPAFTFILKLEEKEARATSIFCILPMVCASSIFYFSSSYIEFETGILCAIGGVIRWSYRFKIVKKIIKQNTKNILYSVSYLCRN